jgi:hypothetical protein
MMALSKFLVLMALFLLASYAYAFETENCFQVNHLIRLMQPMSKPMNESTCKPTVEQMIHDQTSNEIQPSSTSNKDHEGVEDKNVFSNHNKTNSTSCFNDKPSSTFQLVVASVMNASLKGTKMTTSVLC